MPGVNKQRNNCSRPTSNARGSPLIYTHESCLVFHDVQIFEKTEFLSVGPLTPQITKKIFAVPLPLTSEITLSKRTAEQSRRQDHANARTPPRAESFSVQDVREASSVNRIERVDHSRIRGAHAGLA